MHSGGKSSAAEPPLIDFGMDDHSSGGAFVWPDSGAATQDVDPFSWTTDELYISATPKDPFGFEGLFTASAPASDPFVGNVNGFASTGGMDLLTGVVPDTSSNPLHENNPFSSQAEPPAQMWSSFHEEGSFKDALSEDLPNAESPTSEGAVDWSSIAFSERTGYGNEDLGFEQAGVSVTERNVLVEKDVPIGKDVIVEKDTKVNVPPSYPPPQVPEVDASTWASSSKSVGFLASGGGRGVYRAPSREIVHAGNPVALELRPRPLKLKEVNQSIRTIMCTDTSVWAAFDHGLKVWDLGAASSSCSEGGNNPLGDEDAASYTVLPSGPTLCLAMDTGNQVVWTGHRDGKMRAWPHNVRGGDPLKRDPVDQILVWDAHQAPVTAITITPSGEFLEMDVDMYYLLLQRSVVLFSAVLNV